MRKASKLLLKGTVETFAPPINVEMLQLLALHAVRVIGCDAASLWHVSSDLTQSPHSWRSNNVTTRSCVTLSAATSPDQGLGPVVDKGWIKSL